MQPSHLPRGRRSKTSHRPHARIPGSSVFDSILVWSPRRITVVGDGSTVRREPNLLPAPLANRLSSALGTPLDWPEAEKVAGQVRAWGIEVCQSTFVVLFGLVT